MSLVSISLVGHQPDLLDPEDSFWCQALEDLETCGQSELLREIEVRQAQDWEGEWKSASIYSLTSISKYETLDLKI